MIGNDLVDLEQAAIDSNWRRKGYLEKLYTSFERDLITTANEPTLMVWLLWSMKEAAYKIHSRQTGIRRFAPATLLCSHPRFCGGSIKGRVTIDKEVFFTKSIIKNTYIHTLAASTISRLSEIRKDIYEYPQNLFDYKSTQPGCVSHHGKYLALIY